MARQLISYRNLPRAIANGSDNVKAAAANMMNDIAYDSRADITEQAVGELDFRGVARNALGFRVRRGGAKPNSLTQFVETNRGWLHYHLHDSNRQDAHYLRHGTKEYIFVPFNKNKQTTKRGKLTATTRKKLDAAYFVKGVGRDKVYVFYRKKRASRSEFIGTLTRLAQVHRTLTPEAVIDNNMSNKANRLFNGYLSGRYRGRYKQR